MIQTIIAMELFDLMSISIDEAEQDLKDGKYGMDT